ncbi:MAG: hypothetical protein IKB28_08560 [Clostridia bacterium]|nr:hypothetical protein [Clostridia bacterium]
MNNETAKVFQEQIGYVFKNPDLLEQAFVRRSYSQEHGGENNEVLEFIGDKVLDFVVVKLLAERYGSFASENDHYDPNSDWDEFVSDLDEGQLTEIKKKLVCRHMLAKRIRMFGFQYALIMGKSDVDQNAQDNESVQEDLFEAIIGAVALDSNWDLAALENVVDLMLEPLFYLDEGFDNEINYVELLQQWYQKKYHRIPLYEYPKWLSWNIQRSNHRQGNISCKLNLVFENGKAEEFEATGYTKSEARMVVAEQAYRYLDECNMLFTVFDEIGEPSMDRAINQLQELYQKGYIGEPWYEFSESYDQDGNPVWRCECHVDGQKRYHYDYYSSKKNGKKDVAYKMLCDIFQNWEIDDET